MRRALFLGLAQVAFAVVLVAFIVAETAEAARDAAAITVEGYDAEAITVEAVEV